MANPQQKPRMIEPTGIECTVDALPLMPLPCNATVEMTRAALMLAKG
jgi:hypothetical protein